MIDSRVFDALVAFAQSVRLDRRANTTLPGDGTGLELLIAPRFQALIETLLAQKFPIPPRVLPEYRKQAIGRPDLALARMGEPARAFIELKQPETSLTPTRLRGHDAAQFKRFSELPLWAFCNFHTIHLYKRGVRQGEAVVLPATALDPATGDTQAERLIRRGDPSAFLDLLETLAAANPMVPRNAREIAEILAHAARLAQHIVLDQCHAGLPPVLLDVRLEFRETLFAHPAAGGYDTSDEDALFANAFAQTLAFGLLLAREASALRARQQNLPVPEITRDAYRALPDGSYPLLRATLRALTQDEVLDILGVGFEVLLDTVNAVNTDLLAATPDTDPILYFYEDFLGVFDPEAKRRHGVFFTPVPVVRFMVAATDRALRAGLGTEGLVDPNVLLLDPACGTGTFLIAAATRVAASVRASMGEGAVAAEIAALANRLHGFELLVGPYTVAHYRMLREVAAHGTLPVGRLPIYLADTLAPPTGAVGVTSHLGFMSAPIVAERQAADTLKRDTPIIAIFGNPPYRRLGEGEEAAIVSGWDNGFWEDLKRPVRQAGWGGELNTFPDLYVAFWRWCLWKLFESDNAPRRGVVCLITNRTFLAGHPYAGLRQMLRQQFDTIDIIDLRGDSRGARPAGIDRDENVFAIQAGVCVLIAQALGGTNRTARAEAHVRYADVWRHAAFTANDKLTLLSSAEKDEAVITFVDIARQGLEDFVPAAFGGLDWPNLMHVFPFQRSGSKSQRDPLVYGLSRQALEQKITAFFDAAEPEAHAMFFPAAEADAIPTKAERQRFSRARHESMDTARLTAYAYRPMDIRYLYSSSNFVSRHGRDLHGAWGAAMLLSMHYRPALALVRQSGCTD